MKKVEKGFFHPFFYFLFDVQSFMCFEMIRDMGQINWLILKTRGKYTFYRSCLCANHFCLELMRDASEINGKLNAINMEELCSKQTNEMNQFNYEQRNKQKDESWA